MHVLCVFRVLCNRILPLCLSRMRRRALWCVLFLFHVSRDAFVCFTAFVAVRFAVSGAAVMSTLAANAASISNLWCCEVQVAFAACFLMYSPFCSPFACSVPLKTQ